MQLSLGSAVSFPAGSGAAPRPKNVFKSILAPAKSHLVTLNSVFLLCKKQYNVGPLDLHPALWGLRG